MSRVAQEQRREGEPTRMSRVQGMIEERWPRRSYTTWIDREGRHIAVRFRERHRRRETVTVEAVANTWLEALDLVAAAKKEQGL